MGVHTTYDEMRDRLRDNLEDCLKQAKELVVTDVWGADQVRDDYALEVFQAVKKARDSV